MTNPVSWLFGGLRTGLLNTATELNQGANWIDASEEGWLELIGAGTGGTFVTETIRVPKVYEPCMGNGECVQGEEICLKNLCVPIGADPCNLPFKGFEFVTTTRFIPNPDIPNDGVVTVPSQQLPGALRIRPVNNVSHFGEQNSPDVQSEISNQFQFGTPPVNPVFRINNCQF